MDAFGMLKPHLIQMKEEKENTASRDVLTLQPHQPKRRPHLDEHALFWLFALKFFFFVFLAPIAVAIKDKANGPPTPTSHYTK